MTHLRNEYFVSEASEQLSSEGSIRPNPNFGLTNELKKVKKNFSSYP